MYDSKTEDQNPAKRIIRNSIQPTFEEELLPYKLELDDDVCARRAAPRRAAAPGLNAPLVILSLSVNIICLSSAVRQSSGTELFGRYFSLIWNSLFARTYRVICYIQRHFRSFIA